MVDSGRALDLYKQAEDYVYGLISGPPSPAPGTSREEIRRRAVARLERMRSFLDFLGNPQDRYHVIHIGGTSGKGSTAALTASILTEAGYRTGLHVSPYLQVATEKLIINGRIAPASRYHKAVMTLAGKAEDWAAQTGEPVTYGEFWVALTFEYFAREEVDYAVIEVGAGGRFDLTNVVKPVVAAITSVGLDHTVTLGDTVEQIAWHKAGILKPGAAALTAVDDTASLGVIQREADEVGVDLQRITKGAAYDQVVTGPAGTTFLDLASGRRLKLRLPGTFQAANGALAAAIARAVPDVDIGDHAIAAGLSSARFPGRMEIVQGAPLVLLDGAHNPQKMEGLATNLSGLFGDRRVVAVFGVLESKRFEEMLAALRPYVSGLVATSPQVYAKPPVSAAEIAGLAGDWFEHVEVEPDPLEALVRGLEITGPDDALLVTGSLYLVGNIREHWYPTQRILEQGTMWPDAGNSAAPGE